MAPVTIDSEAENNLVHDLCGDESCWIGLNDREEEGQWVWPDGTLAWAGGVDGVAHAYTNWNAGEPNDSNGEDCAELRADSATGSWNDLDCGDDRDRVVCERAP